MRRRRHAFKRQRDSCIVRYRNALGMCTRRQIAKGHVCDTLLLRRGGGDGGGRQVEGGGGGRSWLEPASERAFFLLLGDFSLAPFCHTPSHLRCDGEPQRQRLQQPQPQPQLLRVTFVSNIESRNTRSFASTSPGRRDVVAMCPTSHFRSIGASCPSARWAAGLAVRQGAETLCRVEAMQTSR